MKSSERSQKFVCRLCILLTSWKGQEDSSVHTSKRTFCLEEGNFLWSVSSFAQVCTPMTAAKTYSNFTHPSQAKDYSFCHTVLMLYKLTMQIMLFLEQTYCGKQLPLTRARWNDLYMTHMLDQQDNLEYKLLYRILAASRLDCEFCHSPKDSMNKSDSSAWLYQKLI